MKIYFALCFWKTLWRHRHTSSWINNPLDLIYDQWYPRIQKSQVFLLSLFCLLLSVNPMIFKKKNLWKKIDPYIYTIIQYIYYAIYILQYTWLSIKRIRKFVKQTSCFLFYCYFVTHTHTGLYIYNILYIYKMLAHVSDLLYNEMWVVEE